MVPILRRWLLLLFLLLPLALPAQASWPRAEGTSLRAVVWNVGREQLYTERAGYLAALRAIDADLVILDEMSGTRDAQDVIALLSQLDAPGDSPWQVVYGTSGDNQRAVFALRGEVHAIPSFAHLPYPPRFLRWARKLRMKPEQRARMDQNLAAGIGAAAAEVRIDGRRLVVVGVDLQCCGDSDDSWEERRRMIEVRAIRSLLAREWSERKPDAVIVAGDFNAVRGLKPVRAMQGIVGHPTRRLAIANAVHANGQERWTWDGRGTPFPSRPIDFLLHSRKLRPLQALVFDAETMSADQRASLDLGPDHFRRLSEHRPVVVDFAWR